LAGIKLQACPQFVLHDVGVKVRMTMEAVFTKGRFPQQRPAQQTVNPDSLPRAMVIACDHQSKTCSTMDFDGLRRQQDVIFVVSYVKACCSQSTGSADLELSNAQLLQPGHMFRKSRA
jgi:hypothetical protein